MSLGSIHVHLLKTEGLNAFLYLLVSWNEGLSQAFSSAFAYILNIEEAWKYNLLIAMYFIPFIQSPANAICFYFPLFLNWTSSPHPHPPTLYHPPTCPPRLFPFLPPYNLVSTQQSSEVFKGKSRSKHLCPISLSNIQISMSSLICLLGISPTLSRHSHALCSLCSIHTSHLCCASKVTKALHFRPFTFAVL